MTVHIIVMMTVDVDVAVADDTQRDFVAASTLQKVADAVYGIPHVTEVGGKMLSAEVK